MGSVKLTQINLSNMKYIDTFDNQRLPRYLKGTNNEDKGFYASDHKLSLSPT